MTRVFSDNPRRRELQLSDAELAALCADSAAHFDERQPYHLGESVHIRRTAAPGLLIQRMVPSLNSITFERKGVVAGSDQLRLDISELFWSALHQEGFATCHLARDGEHVLISEERAVPVEVIVKAAFVGTPARIYQGLAGRTDRFGRVFEQQQRHPPYVRFDYRNPLRGPKGELLRDECMPEALADRLIDTHEAARNALRIFEVVGRLLARVGLHLWDACLLFDEAGRVLCYEISPDNLRVKSADWAAEPQPRNEFDKDLWRRGTDATSIESQWRILYQRLRNGQELDSG